MISLKAVVILLCQNLSSQKYFAVHGKNLKELQLLCPDPIEKPDRGAWRTCPESAWQCQSSVEDTFEERSPNSISAVCTWRYWI